MSKLTTVSCTQNRASTSNLPVQRLAPGDWVIDKSTDELYVVFRAPTDRVYLVNALGGWYNDTDSLESMSQYVHEDTDLEIVRKIDVIATV